MIYVIAGTQKQAEFYMSQRMKAEPAPPKHTSRAFHLITVNSADRLRGVRIGEGDELIIYGPEANAWYELIESLKIATYAGGVKVVYRIREI